MTNPTINSDSIGSGDYPAYIKDITLFNRGNNLIIETNFVLKQVLSRNGTQTAAANMRNRLLGHLGILLVAVTDEELGASIFQDRNKLRDYIPSSTVTSVKSVILGIPTVGDKSDIELAQMGALNGVDLPYSYGFSFNHRNPNYLAVFAVPITKLDATSPWETATNIEIGLMASELVIKNGNLNTESILFFKPGLAGNTSITLGHRHQYNVSQMGSGLAEEICEAGGILLEGGAAAQQLGAPVTAGPGPEIPPGAPVMCHEHTIVGRNVQPGGHVPHVHNLVATPEDGILWIGDVHQDSQGRWRTGATAAPAGSTFFGELLATKKIYTSKIFDQRNLARIERLQVDFNKVSGLLGANVSQQLRKRLKALEYMRGGKVSFVSDVYYSKSVASDLRLTFGFNYLEAIKRNGIYASLYESNSQLLDTCSVKSFRVVRRRVKEPNLFNKLTGGDTPQRIYDDEPLEIIGQPTRLGMLDLNTGVYQYMIADGTFDDITTGLYEYGIEVSIIDNTKSKLVDILRNPQDGLDVLIPEIETFLTESLMRNNYNITSNRYTKDFLQQITNRYGAYIAPGAPWTAAAMKYLASLQLLFGTQLGDISMLRANLLGAISPDVSGPTGIQFLLKLLQAFASSLRTAIGEDHPKAPGAAQTSATSTSGASSRLKVFKIQQFFLNPINADDLLNYGFDYLNIQAAPGSSVGLPRLTVDDWNNLSALEAEKIGGENIDPTAPTAQNPNVKFLTPNYLRMPNEAATSLFSTDEYAQFRASTRIYRLLRSNMSRNSPPFFPNMTAAPNNASSNVTSDQSATYLVQNQIMEMNSCGVSVFNQSQQDPIANIFGITATTTTPADDYKHLVDTEEYFSSTSKFANENPANIVLDFTSGSTSHTSMLPGYDAAGPNVQEAQDANSSVISQYLLQADFFTHPGPNSPLPSLPPAGRYINNNDTTLAALKETQKAIAIYMNSGQFVANQGRQGIAALIGGPPPGDIIVSETDMAYVNAALAGNIKPEDVAMTAVKYGFVHVVEYLAGYKIANGESLLSAPVWSYLNDSIIGLVDTGKTFLCRLRKHPGPMGAVKGLEVPTYNEYFILGSGNFAATVAPGTNSNVASDDVPINLLYNMTQFSDSSEYASSYDPDVSYGFSDG
jgi:hypothetical protein